jgi:hypothetical protein
MEKVVALPIDPKDLVERNKKALNTKQILWDLVKDHLIPHIAGERTAKDI